MASSWVLCSDIQPPENLVVDTKIDNQEGIRNEQSLQKIGNLWWMPKGDTYVYYQPTHWRYK